MSGTAGGDEPAIKAMRLRADPPRPLRLSRKVAMAGVAGLALAIAAAVGVGLLKPDADAPTVELTRSSGPPPDAVRALPGSDGGDLLAAQVNGQPASLIKQRLVGLEKTRAA